MKRIAFLAAALALVGTGCVSESNPPVPSGDIALYWQFQDLDLNLAGDFGATSTGCTQAAVTDVDVEIWDAYDRPVVSDVGTYAIPCAQGGVPGALYTLPVGTYTYTLTAYRLVDPVFTASGSFSVAQDVQREKYATLDVVTPAPLTLYYKMNGTFSCSNVWSTPTIYYYLTTAGGSYVSDADVLCDPVNFGFSLPPQALGNYTLTWFQAIDSGAISRYEKCNVAVRHGGFPTTVNLLPAPDSSCPL